MTGYFMNTYHVIIDDDMIRNMLQTNLNESLDLLSIKQVLYFLFLAVIPSYILYKKDIQYQGLKRNLFTKIKIISISLIIITIFLFLFSKHYTSFLREHKPLRYSVNPTYWIYSSGKYIGSIFKNSNIEFKHIGNDATIKQTNELPKLVIMVVGEAARADHFSLNGYKKETNPLLSQENIVNFPNISSCGTSTAISVPCMFSIYSKSNFNYEKGISTENVLDVLHHTKKVEILWRDNNSDSKGVALRLPYEDFKTKKKNTICIEGECRDEGMLIGLDKYINTHKNKNILIVLHQMGNHGPAYFKRYPKKFEKFTPTCQTNQLEQCTQEEIQNTYDNAILYTDYFLNKTISFLKNYNHTHQSAMIYMADHGESLGENGIYLHGLPYFIAPTAQTHIASLMWFNKEIEKNLHIKQIKDNTNKHYSQDNLFHTLLGIFNVETNIYNKKMDMLE
jgi:lipid A ethanolaminephosphotransferase